MGRCVGITVLKVWSRVGARTGTLKEHYEMSMAWKPDRRSNFFIPPAHLCAVTYMTEISLIVTLNNQFTYLLILPTITVNYKVFSIQFTDNASWRRPDPEAF